MKRKLTLISAAFLLSAAFTLMSCGNDEIDNTAFITPDGKVDVTRAVEFRVNFGDYNSEEEMPGTRAAKTEGSDTLSRQYVELGNDLLAEVTVQKDTAKAQTSGQRPVTRALGDDTYTMLAYKDGVLKGEMTGVVSNGRFTATSSNGYINLATGTYDFVLFNSKVTRNGDNLTVIRSNVDKALIGRTQYKVEPKKNQTVTFNMNHAGSRLRIKLTGYMPFTASATLSSVDASSVPYTVTYNTATDTWSNGTEATTSSNLTFPASSQSGTAYTATSNGYQYFLPSTNPSRLKLKFTDGSIYNKPMKDAGLTLSVPTLSSMKANASYVINVKLMYGFLYLMSDGTTGPFKATTYGGGDKTPIGVVVSRSNRLAVALKDANNGSRVTWYKESTNQQQNYRAFYIFDVAPYLDMDGYKYTWNSNAPNGSSVIKAEKMTTGVPDYPAFYYAGHYGEELSAELATKGKTLSNGMEKKKWHLPSIGEWKFVFTTLGFGNEKILTSYIKYYNWYAGLLDGVFTQVGGTGMLPTPFIKPYLSSTEFYDGAGYRQQSGAIVPDLQNINFGTRNKGGLVFVRAFVKY